MKVLRTVSWGSCLVWKSRAAGPATLLNSSAPCFKVGFAFSTSSFTLGDTFVYCCMQGMIALKTHGSALQRLAQGICQDWTGSITQAHLFALRHECRMVGCIF